MADTQPDPTEIHTGYTPEDGVLSRFREWTDVFGWLRLGRVMRMAGSPTMLGIVALALAIWLPGTMLVAELPPCMPIPIPEDSHAIEHAADSRIVRHLAGSAIQVLPTSLLGTDNSLNGFWANTAFVLWSVVVWTTPLLVLMRQGALLTAGRTMSGTVSVTRLALKRTVPAWLITLIPFACALAIGILVAVIGFASRVAMGAAWIEVLFGCVAAIVGLIGGILIFGSYAAIPIGFAALINEKEPDLLDALSRGYEYLYRRPISLAKYIAFSLIASGVVVLLAYGIAESAKVFCQKMLGFTGASDSMIATTKEFLSCVPTIVAVTVAAGLIGGIYLLLRCDAGGQEPEDIWEPPPIKKRLLPSLQSQDSADASE